MNRPQLRAVPIPQPQPKKLTNEQRRKRIESLRKSLLMACVNYAVEGDAEHDHHVWQDRVREASEWGGIPRNLIENEVAKERKRA